MLRGFDVKDLEPALEPLRDANAEAQRLSTLAIKKQDACASIRVVPPSLRSLIQGSEGFCSEGTKTSGCEADICFRPNVHETNAEVAKRRHCEAVSVCE